MTNIKRINELTTEELKKVFDANDKLQHEVMDDMAESEMFWIGEQLDYLRESLGDWSIGQCNRNQHISISHPVGFIRGMDKLQRDMGALNDGEAMAIPAALEKAERWVSTDIGSDEFDALQYEVEEEAKHLADLLVAKYTRTLDEYCLDHDNARDHFIEFYADERMGGDFYIEQGTYELYEDVSYTKSYA